VTTTDKGELGTAQFNSQSMGVLRFGPCAGAMTLPSGPIAGSRSGRETLVSAAVAPGGGSSPPLRPQPAMPSAAASAPRTAIRAKGRSGQELNFGLPSAGKPYRAQAATTWPNCPDQIAHPHTFAIATAAAHAVGGELRIEPFDAATAELMA